MEGYFDQSGRDDVWTGGVKMIPIETSLGTFQVWTKRIGNHPTKKLLLLHGGPGATHEYFESADSYFPGESIEYYYYDQLGSGNSDPSEQKELWSIEHYVEEVEQVRTALNLSADNFFLLGHSWGGILAIEYALKYQQHLKGLIISNMVPSIPDYIEYANTVLAAKLDPAVLQEIRGFEQTDDYENSKYLELITEHYYPRHVLRRPPDQWPEPVNRCFANLNFPIYVHMQGPSEFGVVGDATLKNWDRKEDLKNIHVPALSIGAQYDTMDPKQMEWMANELPNGRFLYCPEGSHMAMYDDQQVYFKGIADFIHNV
jgi:proline iminopeptidase